MLLFLSLLVVRFHVAVHCWCGASIDVQRSCFFGRCLTRVSQTKGTTEPFDTREGDMEGMSDTNIYSLSLFSSLCLSVSLLLLIGVVSIDRSRSSKHRQSSAAQRSVHSQSESNTNKAKQKESIRRRAKERRHPSTNQRAHSAGYTHPRRSAKKVAHTQATGSLRIFL